MSIPGRFLIALALAAAASTASGGLLNAGMNLAGKDVNVVQPYQDDQDRARHWIEENLGRSVRSRPFSFTYGSQPSSAFLSEWKQDYSTRRLDRHRRERSITYTDAATGLQVQCVSVEYADFPTVEWTLYFTNTGTADTPIIEGIKALDTSFRRGDTGEFLLHYQTGDNNSADSYSLHRAAMTPGKNLHFSSDGGRPTTGGFPYFNLEQPGGGVIAVVSWGGQWSADFVRDQADGLKLSAGQELTHFTLHPGEKVRSPMAVLQFYSGDWLEAQNTWRRWMLKHNLPRVNGKLEPPMLVAAEGVWSNWNEQKLCVDKYTSERIPFTYWWHDAGWYPCPDNEWWWVGTWEPDRARYPGGLKQLSDYVHERGRKLITWFEPERVHHGTWLAENHPEWILGGSEGGVLNLGEPKCWSWIVEKIDGLLVSEGIDLYRQDFNISPLDYWRSNDTSDRQGITEIYHVMGYYAFWDELRRRHPNMLIDSCASGGRRNDLETLRRSLPLLRTDYDPQEPIGQQCITCGISMWMPYYGSGLAYDKTHVVRSCFAPCFGIMTPPSSKEFNNPEHWADVRRLTSQWQTVSQYMLADFYPLTPFSLANDVWIAWQFNDPGKGQGYIQAFRRGDATSAEIKLRLRGLDRDREYALTDLDTDRKIVMTGAELMDKGLPVNLKEAPSDALFVYGRMPEDRGR